MVVPGEDEVYFFFLPHMLQLLLAFSFLKVLGVGGVDLTLSTCLCLLLLRRLLLPLLLRLCSSSPLSGAAAAAVLDVDLCLCCAEAERERALLCFSFSLCFLSSSSSSPADDHESNSFLADPPCFDLCLLDDRDLLLRCFCCSCFLEGELSCSCILLEVAFLRVFVVADFVVLLLRALDVLAEPVPLLLVRL